MNTLDDTELMNVEGGFVYPWTTLYQIYKDTRDKMEEILRYLDGYNAS